MHNYFQSKKLKRLAKNVFAVVFAVLVCVAVNIGHNADKAVVPSIKHENTMYLSAFEPVFQKQERKDDKSDAEMNNKAEENSKNEEPVELKSINPQKNGILCKTVSVKTNNGVVNMELEEYVKGCVLGEMPTDFEAQALMAQAVAVRSFTVRRTFSSRNSHKYADVCTDYNCCQNYISPDDERFSAEAVKKVSEAVYSTKGIVAVYDGFPIEAAYHASSGYSTLSSEEVWGGRVPYLTSVKAPSGEAEISKKEYYFTMGEISQKLSSFDGKAVTCAFFGSDFGVHETDNNLTVSLWTDSGVFDKFEVKRALGLSSSDFKTEPRGDGVAVTSYGFGHRVGMSQHGANLLAKEGMNYIDILKYYYSGVSLSFLDEE